MCPNNKPCVAKIKENSPTCANAFAVKKEGLLVYLNNEQTVIIINGLKEITMNKSTTIGNHKSLIAAKERPIPKDTKNNNAKKSFKLS